MTQNSTLLTPEALTELTSVHQPPCLSLYQPTHRRHPENQQDPIRFGNLVKALEESLQQQFPKNETRSFLEPFLALAGDRNFWNHTLDGLAVLGTKGMFQVYRLQRPIAELAVVADTFHTKPLKRILQSVDRYHVLGLNRHEIKLFEGNRDALVEIELAQGIPRTITQALGDELSEPHSTVASYGGVGQGSMPMHHGHGGKESEVDIDAERFFRVVDRAVLEHQAPTLTLENTMQIQINTDRNIEGREALAAQVSGVVESALSRFSDRITRVEVHLSDENSAKKGGHDDIRCMMEARLEGRNPVAVTHQAAIVDEAVDGAADKLTRLIESTIGKLHDQKRRGTDPPPPGAKLPEA